MSGKVVGIAAGIAGLLTLGSVTVATAAPPPSWHVAKSVPSGVNGDFTAMVATGKATGWAFDGISGPTAWQRHGRTWTEVRFPGKAGESVVAAAATSPSDVWTFTDVGAGSRVLRWNGHTWSVVATFPEPIGGTAVLARNDVWVFGQPGIIEQLGAWHKWRRVAEGSFGYGTMPSQQIAPDGHGGLWLPMPGLLGAPSYLLHYAAGKFTTASLPTSAKLLDVESVARIRGTTQVLAGGFTHARNDPWLRVVAVILQFN